MKVKKRVISISEYCIGCGLCRLACQVEHSPYPNNIVKAMRTGERPVPRMTVEVSAEGFDFRTVRCRHCDDPECIKVCISGAITKNPDTGVVTIDQDKCVGCWSCILVCPYGAVTGPAGGQTRAYKCDLCPNRDKPACVVWCPNEALKVIEVSTR